MIAHSAMSVGYGREVGVIMLIYIMAFAYAACSPIILPFTLCYFTSVWVRARTTHEQITDPSCGCSATSSKAYTASLVLARGCCGAPSLMTVQYSNPAAANMPPLGGSQPEA